MGSSYYAPLGRPNDPGTFDWLLNGKPSGTFRENFSRTNNISLGGTFTSGVMYSMAIPLWAGDVIRRFDFKTGTTGVTNPTNHWAALYDDSATPALIAQTPDLTTEAWAGSTIKTFTLASDYVVPRDGVYYVGLMIAAAGMPNGMVIGVTATGAAAGAFYSGQKALAVSSGSSLTTTAPATISAPTTFANPLYFIARS